MSWDSGIGSLSSEQASSGSRRDRPFTAQDYQNQLNDPYALQEALRHARGSADHWERKAEEYKTQLLDAHKAEHEARARIKAQLDHAEQLEQELKDVKAERDSWKNRYFELEQDLSGSSANSNPMMPAAPLPIRTKSNRESHREEDNQRMRLKTRMSPKDDKRPKSKTRKSGRDRSRASSTKREVYIEEMPSTPKNPSRRLSTSESHRSSRSSQPTSTPIYSGSYDGNYQAYPLPDSTRGRRS